MDKKSRQEALNNPSAEDLEKLRLFKSKVETPDIEDEWLLLTEFAKEFGWLAYKDAILDNISMPEMLTLIEANRQLKYREYYMQAQVAFIAAVSAQSKNPSATFTKLTKDIANLAKVEK